MKKLIGTLIFSSVLLSTPVFAGRVHLLYDDIGNIHNPVDIFAVFNERFGSNDDVEESNESNESNNGHGNNIDGVDVSNPGRGNGGPNGRQDPSGTIDDERR